MVLKRIITMSHYNKEMQLRKTCKLYAYVLDAQDKEVWSAETLMVLRNLWHTFGTLSKRSLLKALK